MHHLIPDAIIKNLSDIIKGADPMIKTTVKVDGMMCGMCESHVNDAVRKAFQVNKVTSSHSKGETVIISEKPVDEAKLKTAISATRYEVKGISSEPYEKKKGLFSFLHK